MEPGIREVSNYSIAQLGQDGLLLMGVNKDDRSLGLWRMDVYTMTWNRIWDIDISRFDGRHRPSLIVVPGEYCEGPTTTTTTTTTTKTLASNTGTGSGNEFDTQLDMNTCVVFNQVLAQQWRIPRRMSRTVRANSFMPHRPFITAWSPKEIIWL